VVVLQKTSVQKYNLEESLDELTFTTLSQCCAPVCLMNPAGALIAATVPLTGSMSFSNSGSRWDAHLLVVWMTARVRTTPRSVLTVIQPALSRSETLITGVFACRFRCPFSRTIRNSA